MIDAHPQIADVLEDGRQKADVLAFINAGVWINRFHKFVGPNVVDALIPEGSTQAVITPRSSILHSNAGASPSRWQQLRGWITRAGNNEEPHAQIDLDGTIAQYVLLNRRGDCAYRANPFAHSYETGDLGSVKLPFTEWPLAQLGAIISCLTATCVVYRIRCTPTTAWTDSGIGWHSMYPEWSKYVGKTCPGAARIRQMPFVYQAVAERVGTYYEICGGSCP